MNKQTRALKILTNQFNFSGFPRAIWAVAGMNVVGGVGWATSLTYMSLYLYQERHIPMTVVGLIMLISGISSGIFQIIGGLAGDRFGHRRMALLFGLAGTIAAIALAVLIQAQVSTWSVVLTAILVPTLGSGGGPPLNAIIARASPHDRLTESYSLMAIAMNIGWSIGPLLGGYLLGFAPFSWLFGIGAAMRGLALTGIPFLPQDEKRDYVRRPANLKSLTPDPIVLVFGLLAALFFLVLSQWGGTLSVFTVDRIGFSTAQYGLLMTISGILIIIFQYPISHGMANYPRRALVLGCLFYAAGFLSLTWVKAFIPAVGSIVIMVIGEMLFIPSALAVVGQMAGQDDEGKGMGFYGLCNTIGSSLGPLLGGFLLDRFPRTPLFLWGPISLCSLIAATGFGVWRGYATKTQS